MPTALQLNGVRTRCRWCSKRLSDYQRSKGNSCCSNDCTRALHYHNGKATFDAMPEPKADEAVAECNRQVFDGKARMRLDLDVLLWQRTPIDESPEAERRLREDSDE